NLFVSNHRDIVLDSAFLNSHLFYKGLPTTQIAIGNNLLAYPWITAAVRMNKAFVVKRDGSIKEQLLISKELSEYIRMVRTEYNESVWIAQREGRAKDSDDRTAPAIIKMFTMSGGRDMAESLEELNITPLSINYEFDPCDYLKAREFQLKRDQPDYKKSQQEDILNMQTGIMGYKGRVMFVIGKPMRNLSAVTGDTPKNEQAALLAKALDCEIHRNYYLFPINYVAADMLEGGNRFAEHYTAKDVVAVEKYLQSRLDLIDIPGKDEAFLRGKMLQMYGNPTLNQERANKC
ncbi:MAG: 1-acyl-sn-glycerol-3-phosphate acyltransferase, partial [Paludibacteraceae bacterium]|nr:1-acyl-sn-glycerol-3-phosphate acyltransferase [Paludibacteraceae bacterium]